MPVADEILVGTFGADRAARGIPLRRVPSDVGSPPGIEAGIVKADLKGDPGRRVDLLSPTGVVPP
jgi:hypothetical protein